MSGSKCAGMESLLLMIGEGVERRKTDDQIDLTGDAMILYVVWMTTLCSLIQVGWGEGILQGWGERQLRLIARAPLPCQSSIMQF